MSTNQDPIPFSSFLFRTILVWLGSGRCQCSLRAQRQFIPAVRCTESQHMVWMGASWVAMMAMFAAQGWLKNSLLPLAEDRDMRGEWNKRSHQQSSLSLAHSSTNTLECKTVKLCRPLRLRAAIMMSHTRSVVLSAWYGRRWYRATVIFQSSIPPPPPPPPVSVRFKLCDFFNFPSLKELVGRQKMIFGWSSPLTGIHPIKSEDWYWTVDPFRNLHHENTAANVTCKN